MTTFGTFAGRGDTLTKSAMGMARPSHYAVDGSGRDTYINLNNGGLYRMHEPGSVMDIGTFSSKRMRRDNTPHIEAKHSNYTSNGTGRDLYIS